MAGLNQFRLQTSLALVFLLAGTTTTTGLHAERGACDADGVDCKDGDTHKDGGAMEGGVDGVQESDVYKQCARLLVGGDAAAASNCFAKVPASDTSWCAEDERTVLVVQMTDVGATKRVDRKMVKPILDHTPLERYATRSNPLVAARKLRQVLGLLFHPDDVIRFLREYMLALWAADCLAAYATAFVLANSTKVGHWAHPLQIPVGGSLGEMGPRAWHDPAEYEATAALEAAWVDIAAEVASLSSGKEGYAANVEDATLVGTGEWSEIRLYEQATGVWNEANCARLPKTCAALRSIPSLSATSVVQASSARGKVMRTERVPGVVSVFRLRPGASLVPHTGPTPERTTLHLPLYVPEGASITVGGETRVWEAGKVLAFDDSFMHSVENTHPTEARTVLLANVWKTAFLHPS